MSLAKEVTISRVSWRTLDVIYISLIQTEITSLTKATRFVRHLKLLLGIWDGVGSSFSTWLFTHWLLNVQFIQLPTRIQYTYMCMRMYTYIHVYVYNTFIVHPTVCFLQLALPHAIVCFATKITGYCHHRVTNLSFYSTRCWPTVTNRVYVISC